MRARAFLPTKKNPQVQAAVQPPRLVPSLSLAQLSQAQDSPRNAEEPLYQSEQVRARCYLWEERTAGLTESKEGWYCRLGSESETLGRLASRTQSGKAGATPPQRKAGELVDVPG